MKINQQNRFLLSVLSLAGFSFAAPSASAANFYWDIDGVTAGAGGATPGGTWTTGGTTWSTSSSGTAATVGYTTLAADDLFFSAGTNATGAFTIGLTNTQNAGSLTFEEGAATISGTDGIITLGGTGGKITVASGLNATIGATTSTIIAGTAGLTKLGNGTLTLNGSLANTYTGLTTLNAGTLALSGGGTITTSTGLILNGGGLSLTNGAAEAALDRVSNAAITSNGGTVTYANTATASTDYAETIGPVALTSGQLNLVLSADQNAAPNTQTLTLGGLTQSGTSAATFSALTTAPNSTTNIIAVTGATATPANQIVGPWATTGVAAASQNLHAVYNTLGQIVPMTVADTAESTWTNAANTYSGIGGVTLTGSRTVNALRYYGAASTLALGNFNLQTYGLLFGGNNIMTVAGTGGVLTTPGGGGNLYLTSGFSAPLHVISAPILNNGGAVTVVKSGTGGLTLSSAFSNFSGGVVINAGLLNASGAVANLGSGSADIVVNGNARLSLFSSATLTTARGINVNNGALLEFGGNGNYTVTGNVTGNGGVASSAFNFGSNVFLNGTANTFEGPVVIGLGSGTGGQSFGVTLASLTDSPTANGRILFNSQVSHATNASVFGYTGSTNLVLNNRQLELAAATVNPNLGHQVRSSGTGTLTINTDLIVSTAPAQTLALRGTNTGANIFAGVIGNGSSTAIGLTKSDAGTWNLPAANTYTGSTRTTGGTLIVNSLANGGAPSSIGQSGSAPANLVLSGGILQYAPIATVGGAAATTDRNFTITTSSSLDSSGTGALVFGNTGVISPDVTGLTGTWLTTAATITGLSSTANLAVGMKVSAAGIVGTQTIASINSASQITLSGNPTIAGTAAAVSFGTNTPRTLTLTGTNTDANTIAGILQNSSAAGAGVLSLTKTGLGTWHLTGNSTFTGNVSITGGTLVAGVAASGANTALGSAVNTRSVTVGTGATLRFDAGNVFSGNFSASGVPSLVINSGTVTNASPATNNALGNVTLNNGTLAATTGSATYGAFNLNGNITSTGTSTISTSDPINGKMILTSSGANNVATSNTIDVQNGTLLVSAPLADLAVAESKISGLTKIGSGTLNLTGTNSYTGVTLVSAGNLTVSGSGTLAGTSSLSVANGAAFNYLPTTIGSSLTLAAASTLTLSDGSTLGLAWNATTANKIVVPGAATVGTTIVGLNMTGAYAPGSTYTILTAASGLDAGSYYFVNPTDYTAVVARTATSVAITPAAATPLTAAYWTGTSTAGLTKVWAGSNGINDSNWAGSAGGAAQALVPGAAADVIISANTVTAAPTATTLGANMTIKSLTIADTTNGLSLNADINTLTITPGAATGGITLNANVPASTIATKLALGADQTWTNDSINPLTVSGVVNGAFGLTKAGPGPVTLSAFNTFTGPITINGGTLEFSASATGANNVYASTQININGASTLRISGTLGNIPIYDGRNYTFDATGGGTILVGAGNYNAVAAGFTITTLGGAQDTIGLITTSGGFGFNLGTGPGVTFNVASGTDPETDLTVAPNIANTGAVTKTGAGRLTFTGNANAYSGGTFINAGTLRVNGSNAVPNAILNTGLVTLANGAGATLQVVASETIGALTGGGATGGAVSIDATKTLTLSSGTQTFAGTVGGDGTLTNAGANQTLTGVVSHTGGVNVTTGGLTLGNSGNTYTGTTAISAAAGVLVTADGALGATGDANGTTVAANGVLGFSGGITYSNAEKIVGFGAGNATSGVPAGFAVGTRGFIQSVSGNNTFTGKIELSTNGESRIGSQDGASLTLTGAITQATGVTTGTILFRVGSLAGDFVTLSNANNEFGGDSTIFTGAAAGYAGVRLGINNGLPTNRTVSSFTGTNGVNTALDLAGFNQSLNGLTTGAGAGALQIINTNTGTPSTLTLDPTADKATTNTLILGGGALGVINVVKDGLFTQTLGAANTYTGNTTVNAGTLTLADNAQLKFVLGASTGTSNTLAGAGTATLDGDFVIDTSAADALPTGSWTLESVTGGGYGATFSVVGFTDAGDNKWTKANGATKIYRFDEATGILQLGPVDYAFWIGSFFPGETNPLIIGAGADPDFDGIPNSVEMVIGGNPATGMDTALLPTIELVTNPVGSPAIPAGDYLLFTYRRSDLSVAGGVTADCETDTDLVAPWTAATGASGVVIQVDNNFTFTPPAAADTDRVRVYVPRAANSKLFGRLNVVVP